MVEITNFERADKKNVKGYFDIKVEIVKPATLIIKRIAYLNNGNKKWYSLPCFTRDAKVEKPQFERYFEFETQSFNTHLLDGLAKQANEYINAHMDSFDFSKQLEENEPLPF